MNNYYRVGSVTVSPEGEWLDWDNSVAVCTTYEAALGHLLQHCTKKDLLVERGDVDERLLAHAVFYDEEGLEYDFRLFKEEFDA